MKIAAVEAIPLAATFADVYGGIENVPSSLLHPASHFAVVPRTGQYASIVRVTDESGMTGIGEAWGLPMPEPAAAIVNRLFAPLVLGRDADDIERIWSELFEYAARFGYTRGHMMEALSGLDIALWDLRARTRNVPLWRLLGGRRRERVPCYASPIMFLETPDESRAHARAFLDQGFQAIKIKTGRGIEIDTAHVASVRDTVGPDVALMVDCNGAYDVASTIDLARELEPYRLTWIEEPVGTERIDELAAIRKAIDTPIATGENDFSLRTFAGLLGSGGVDVVMPNVTRAGGITGVLRIAGLAQQHGAGFSLHGVGSGLMQYASIHLSSVLPNAHPFEFNQFLNPLRETLVEPAPVFEDGAFVAPDCAGVGCELNWEAVERFRVDR